MIDISKQTSLLNDFKKKNIENLIFYYRPDAHNYIRMLDTIRRRYPLAFLCYYQSQFRPQLVD